MGQLLSSQSPTDTSDDVAPTESAAGAQIPKVTAVDQQKDNFWKIMNVVSELPEHLRFLYRELYRRTHPSRVDWGGPLDVTIPPQSQFGQDGAAAPSPDAASVGLGENSTWFRYCEEFALHPRLFKFSSFRDHFLENHFDKFDASVVLNLLKHSSVHHMLVASVVMLRLTCFVLGWSELSYCGIERAFFLSILCPSDVRW